MPNALYAVPLNVQLPEFPTVTLNVLDVEVAEYPPVDDDTVYPIAFPPEVCSVNVTAPCAAQYAILVQTSATAIVG